jgi:hypothetical protein
MRHAIGWGVVAGLALATANSCVPPDCGKGDFTRLASGAYALVEEARVPFHMSTVRLESDVNVDDGRVVVTWIDDNATEVVETWTVVATERL